MHVILVGNPGVGKSLILNAVIGYSFFRSGVCLGTGLTRTLDVFRTPDGTHYIDTPGLDDVSSRDFSATELSRALSLNGHCKLVFVCTLEDGRIRPSDMTTLRLIIDAVRNTGANPNGRYAIIINKVPLSIMTMAEQCTRIKDDLILTFSTIAPVRHIQLFPLIESASGISDVQLHGEEAFQYRRFIQVAPLLLLPSVQPAFVDASAFNDTRADIQRRLEQTRETLDALHLRGQTGGSLRTQERGTNSNRITSYLLDRLSFLPSMEDMLLLANLFLGSDFSGSTMTGSQFSSSTERYLLVTQFCLDVGVPLISRLLGYSSSRPGSSSGTTNSSSTPARDERPAGPPPLSDADLIVD